GFCSAQSLFTTQTPACHGLMTYVSTAPGTSRVAFLSIIACVPVGSYVKRASAERDSSASRWLVIGSSWTVTEFGGTPLACRTRRKKPTAVFPRNETTVLPRRSATCLTGEPAGTTIEDK